MGKEKKKKAASKKPAKNKKTKTTKKATKSPKPQKAPKVKKEKSRKQTSKPKAPQKIEASKAVQSKPSKRTRKRKWNRAHEFARKKSTEREVGHPVLIVGKRRRFRKYLVFTHTPKEGDEENYEKLKHNIDPDEEGKKDSYVKKTPDVSMHTNLREPDKQYRIHEDDKETIKRYRQ